MVQCQQAPVTAASNQERLTKIAKESAGSEILPSVREICMVCSLQHQVKERRLRKTGFKNSGQGSQLSVNPVSGDPTPFSDLQQAPGMHELLELACRQNIHTH